MPNVYITRLVNLEQSDFWIIKRVAQERGLGGKGFSAVLRMIIREWQKLQESPPASPSQEILPRAE